MIPPESRRQFLGRTLAAATLPSGLITSSQAQGPGDRPSRQPGVTVLNPRDRVPVGIIIDDSTCLVNLNRFAMPQFDEAWGGKNASYHRNWRDWPMEIPDSFVRRFGDWATERGVKGKYSIVPYPACVGRLDRVLPGWSRQELDASLRLVRDELMPNWDIHPEMVTHTRVIDTRTGHPYPECSRRFMENWDWTTGRSADEIADYLAYALRILRNVDLPCEGITTPGGFGSQARPQLARATLESVRDVFETEIPHYFRDLYSEGDRSVAPRVELAAELESPHPQCVVSIVGCTGDWTGGWDCVEPAGTDRFITPDLQAGRLVEVIGRGEPALMVCHWTGIYWNGRELGLDVFREVERRLRAGFADQIRWMKLSEVARYWAAKELTRLAIVEGELHFDAPFGCPDFTVRWKTGATHPIQLRSGVDPLPLREVSSRRELAPGTWVRSTSGEIVACVDLPRGKSRVQLLAPEA